MVIDLIFIAVTLVALIAASISDIKVHEVPNWISYSLIAIGFSLRLLYSITTKEWSYFLLSLLTFTILFLIGNLMYYTKQWGGGDTKIAIALSVIFATHPTQKFFLISFFITLMVIGSLYSIIISIFLIIKNKGKFKITFLKLAEKIKYYKYLTLILIITTIIFIFLIKDIRIRILLFISSILLILYPYLTIALKAVELSCMYRLIPIKNLREGDWIVNNVYINKKLIYNKSSPGIDQNQIELIKKSKIKNVLIKEGIAFIPAFLISFIVTLIFGNIISNIL